MYPFAVLSRAVPQLLFHALQDHWRPAPLLADLLDTSASLRHQTPSSQQLLVRVDEWGQHDQHFKSGPTRARAADLTVISRTL